MAKTLPLEDNRLVLKMFSFIVSIYDTLGETLCLLCVVTAKN